ncbi:DUF2461 domain-containing protein [Solimicrobium silvestre]|uniref:TIGR02453 family protein n=1 Tax=Solimicrobium silvestre TaxID=2099400 RepID=A0A2S9H1Y2_9BURK|nr:DUF2461 domain-containing protein [Solimicrobium silvestre]PRC93995.1 hypothetical protein S2091_1168 [Solimicrobium silvestre]
MHIQDLTRYLAELSDNNNRAWFVMNKPRYDILREEFLALVSDLIVQISKFDPLILGCNPKKALFRINRDVRFANDKSPYKTTFSAAIAAGDIKKPSQGGGPVYYFHLSANGDLRYAVGEYTPPADRLKQIRNHIAENGASLAKILKAKKLQAAFGGLQEKDKLLRAPKGFEPDHPQIELIKLKHFMVWNVLALSELTIGQQTEELTKILVGAYKDAYPLVCWLREAGL